MDNNCRGRAHARVRAASKEGNGGKRRHRTSTYRPSQVVRPGKEHASGINVALSMSCEQVAHNASISFESEASPTGYGQQSVIVAVFWEPSEVHTAEPPEKYVQELVDHRLAGDIHVSCRTSYDLLVSDLSAISCSQQNLRQTNVSSHTVGAYVLSCKRDLFWGPSFGSENTTLFRCPF